MKASSERFPRGSVPRVCSQESRSTPYYRVIQFVWALRASLWPTNPSEARAVLPGPLFALFQKMSRAERAHSLRVMRWLQERAATQPELLQAALLHDVGKTRFPLRLWERAAIVLARRLVPALALRWSQGATLGVPRGWKRPFVPGARHAEWGAEMAAEAGAPPLTAALIRRHPGAPSTHPPLTEDDRLLRLLQEADSQS